MTHHHDRGQMTVSEAGQIGGQIGGQVTKSRYGQEFYQEIGQKGGQRVSELIRKGKEAEEGKQ